MTKPQDEKPGRLDAVVNRPHGHDSIKQLVLAIFLVAFCGYGFCRMLEDIGVIVWYADGSSHFWFEAQARNWINGE